MNDTPTGKPDETGAIRRRASGPATNFGPSSLTRWRNRAASKAATNSIGGCSWATGACERATLALADAGFHEMT